jgi:hypothetical protein
VIDDFKRGKAPNIFAERGWDAEWKYNRQAVIKNVAIGTLAALIVFRVMQKKR